jgi:hypothetical protein
MYIELSICKDLHAPRVCALSLRDLSPHDGRQRRRRRGGGGGSKLRQPAVRNQPLQDPSCGVRRNF